MSLNVNYIHLSGPLGDVRAALICAQKEFHLHKWPKVQWLSCSSGIWTQNTCINLWGLAAS